MKRIHPPRPPGPAARAAPSGRREGRLAKGIWTGAVALALLTPTTAAAQQSPRGTTAAYLPLPGPAGRPAAVPPKAQAQAPVPEQPPARATLTLEPVAAQGEQLPAPDSSREPPDLSRAPPSLPPPAQTLPIDLCTALRLAEGDNPTIGISRQAIQEALADQLRANALLLPSLRAGGNYHDHQGVLQNSFGEIRHVHTDSLYVGGGARALAAETVAFPMIQLFSPLADAFFEPLVARRQVAVRRAQSAATANQVLLEVASRFLELVSAEAELVALRQSEEDMNEVVRLTVVFAEVGQARGADASRARGAALLLHTEEQRAEERVAIASANLAEVLNLDTAVRLQTPGQATGLLQLVDLRNDLDALVAQAQAARPELAANAAEIARREALYREEKFRPLLPTLSVGFSSGTFGGGTNRVDLVANPGFGKFGSRADFDVLAFWNVQNLGAGNAARQNERRAQREIATIEQVRLLHQVRREVVTAYSRAEAGWRRVEVGRDRLRSAEAGHREDLGRTRGGQGLPIEILNSTERLVRARLALIQSILEYNLGQFQLFVALGQRPTNACPPACTFPPSPLGGRGGNKPPHPGAWPASRPAC
jgi:outer membrane protein TolC